MFARLIKIVAIMAVVAVIAGASAYLTLTLLIKSEPTVIVPDLIGKNALVALKRLSEMDLNTKVSGARYDDSQPENHVLFQDPDPGSEIKTGRDVRITISKGPEQVSLPKLVGLSAAQARIILEENGLCLGQQASTHHGLRRHQVVAQTPSSGVIVSRSQCVDLLVSLGPRPTMVLMPDLAGRVLDDALLTIESHHLSPGQITSQVVKGRPGQSVLKQQPAAGAPVLEGTAVQLVVNRLRGIQSGQSASKLKRVYLFRHRLPSGFLKKHVRIRLNRPGLQTDLFDAFVKPGEEVWVLVPNTDEATLLLYEDGELIKSEII